MGSNTDDDNIVKNHLPPADTLVLIVEDEEAYSKLLANYLVIAGYTIQIANNGEKAIEMARQNNPNIVLLDLLMPTKDGFSVIQEMRSDADLKRIPIIVYSNVGQEEQIAKAEEMGANEFFVKVKTELPEVINTIKRYI